MDQAAVAAAEPATSTASISLRPSLYDSFVFADPHAEWTQALISRGGRAAAEGTSSFDALLQLHGDAHASRHFLLDEPPPPPVAASQNALLYADNQCSSPAASTPEAFPHLLNKYPPTTSVPAAVKKPRIETPPPLPTFKVRKEKLGDRITALQQLVSPFGKTDTASVLHEATKYIKFLHDQVASLSSPYFKCERTMQLQKQQGSDVVKGAGGKFGDDLRSRGLCLVPVASETAPEFWHLAFGGTFR
ncbi:hypothetical protein ACP70R_035622 [Stipagrostis hirtigluma subsp. patula]